MDDLADPTPRRGWFRRQYSRAPPTSKSKYKLRKKFGSTLPRFQNPQWQLEDDRFYYVAKYGWSSCYWCGQCSCCCKCNVEEEENNDNQ